MQDLRHPHSAAVFNPLCATQQYGISWTNYFRQVRCNVARCGRGGRKYDQVSIGAIAKLRSNVHRTWELESGKIIAVFSGLLHACDPIRVVAPENNWSTILCPQTSQRRSPTTGTDDCCVHSSHFRVKRASVPRISR